MTRGMRPGRDVTRVASTRRASCLALTSALVVLSLACRDDPAARRQRAEAQVLERQNQSLRELISAAREERLISPGWIVAAVDEAAVESILGVSLPQDAVVGRFRVLVERAEVSFQGGTSLVSLQAQITDERSPDRRASVIFQGGLDEITISADGRLETRVLVDHVEVPEIQAARVDAGFLGALVDELAGRSLDAVQRLIPAISIPVKFERSLAVDGRSEGPVQVDGGDLPVVAGVARVLPLAGRLWIFVDAKVGPWKPRPVPVSSAASAPGGAR